MKAIKLLFLLSAIVAIYSQDCNNPLLSTLDISGLDSPTVPDGNLTFCPVLQDQPICCDAATVNGFQGNVQTAIDNLVNLASQRDRWLADSYNNIFPNFLTNFFIFNASMAALRNISPPVYDAAVLQFAYLNDSAVPLRAAMRPLRQNWASYQQARVQCYVTMMDYLASAYCLACSPNYQTQGLNTNGTLDLSNRVCTTIKNSCFRFVTLSNYYTLFISLRQVSDQLFQANNFLRSLDLADSPNQLVSEIQGETVPFDQTFETNEPILQQTVLPPNCTTAANCNWLCTDVFNNADINNELLALGGLPVQSLAYDDIANRSTAAPQAVSGGGGGGGSRLLQNDTDAANATNATTAANATNATTTEVVTTNATWNPATNSSGIAIVVLANPANVTLSNGTNETAIQVQALAFAEPPDPNQQAEESQETVLSGTILTISAGLLSILVMFYLE